VYIGQVQVDFVLCGHASQHEHQLLHGERRSYDGDGDGDDDYNELHICVVKVCQCASARHLLRARVRRLLHEHLQAVDG
jgi:hypothetical protein